MKYISMMVLAGLLVGCGDEQKPSSTVTVVQGEIQYTDLQGKSTGSLRGADIARVELRASGNQQDYDVDLFDQNGQVIVSTLANLQDFSTNQFMLYTDFKNQKGCADPEGAGLKGCNDLTLSMQPATGELRLKAQQSPLVVVSSANPQNISTTLNTGNINLIGSKPIAVTVNSFTQVGTMNGELVAQIQPNALIFKTNRFPRTQQQGQLTVTYNNTQTTLYPMILDTNRVTFYQGQLIHEISLNNPNASSNPNDIALILLRLDPQTHQLIGVDGRICLVNCQPQVKQTGHLIELNINQAKFGYQDADQVSYTISGQLAFTATIGQLNTASSTVFIPHNFSTHVINNTAHYEFTQLFANQPNHTKQLNIAVENGQVQQMSFEDIVGGETTRTTTLATCSTKAAQPCQGIRLAADGLTFNFDQIKLQDGSVMSGSITHGGV